jgi:lipopolysaccharide biosynthesis regulator YciM
MAKENDITLSIDEGKLIARAGSKQTELTYENAFSLGHSMLDSGQYEQAQGIFTVLARVRGHGPRAKLMLSKCKAVSFNFEACDEILHTIFEGEDEPIAEELQAAFKANTLGTRENAILELVNIVNKRPDLPTVCLFLGDLFREVGKLNKTVECWKLAIKRDRQGGGVALAARKELTKLANQMKAT